MDDEADVKIAKSKSKKEGKEVYSASIVSRIDPQIAKDGAFGQYTKEVKRDDDNNIQKSIIAKEADSSDREEDVLLVNNDSDSDSSEIESLTTPTVSIR